ncbi:MAG TPA: hypothetical protein ENI26_10615 [Methylophaga aminisulfidivorans]|uniref:Uncharacterized protein n=1 Tax=Methylophaga aminisulfidivorans TaxID=230105 RepID=A0A7C1W105_9GAMM|nr:hypothetical protein [Methylophaga aminisulfidivorans]
MPPVVFGVNIDRRRLISDLRAQVAEVKRLRNLKGDIINSATVARAGGSIPLFPFLDRGTKPHIIVAASGSALASDETNPRPLEHPVKVVAHPGSAPHDISARVFSFFVTRMRERFFGQSPGAVSRRKDEIIRAELIRSIFVRVLKDTKRFAAQITPSNWKSVKRSYEIRLGGRRVS